VFLSVHGEVPLGLNPILTRNSDAPDWASECPDVKNYKWRLNQVWHRMYYSCTRMATVGFKGLRQTGERANDWVTTYQWCHRRACTPGQCNSTQTRRGETHDSLCCEFRPHERICTPA